MARKVSVIGLGYVGLTMAACLADRGIPTVGVDIDQEKLDLLRRGITPFYEPGLQEILVRCLSAKRLTITDDCEEAVRASDITFIAVGTPSNADGSINLDQVKAASASIGSALKRCTGYRLIVVRSTVTPGTTEHIVKPLLESASGKLCGLHFGLCVNPEFLREGSAIHDTFNPDRIIIGEHDKSSGDQLEDLYRLFHGDGMPTILRTSPTNAELIKYANNAFLAMKVSYINMVASLCLRIPGADVEEVARGIGLDKRIGPLFLKAGLGWGGSCFHKDLKALLSFAKGVGIDLPLVEATIIINEQQPLKAIEMAEQFLGDLKGKKAAILGLAFKPGTDDARGAISIKIIKALLERGMEVVAYDPVAIENTRKILGDRIAYARSALECIDGADTCIIVTEWEEFKKLQPQDFLERMRSAVVIDGRRIFNPEDFEGRVKFAAIGLCRDR